MRRIYTSMEETETPADLHDGEVVEAVRLGGPRDGDTISHFTVRRAGDVVNLEPFADSEAGDGE